jgi:hypothetical protein
MIEKSEKIMNSFRKEFFSTKTGKSPKILILTVSFVEFCICLTVGRIWQLCNISKFFTFRSSPKELIFKLQV